MRGRSLIATAAVLLATTIGTSSGCTVMTGYLQQGSMTEYTETRKARVYVTSNSPDGELIAGEERIGLATETELEHPVKRRYRRKPYWKVVAAGLLSLAAGTAGLFYGLEEDDLVLGLGSIIFAGADVLIGGPLTMGVIVYNDNRKAKAAAAEAPIEASSMLTVEWTDGVRATVPVVVPTQRGVVVDKPLDDRFEGALIRWVEGEARELGPDELLAVARAYVARAGLGSSARDLERGRHFYQRLLAHVDASEAQKLAATSELAAMSAPAAVSAPVEGGK